MGDYGSQTPSKDVLDLKRRLREAAYIDSPFNTAQAPWTATRCLRLLRPISSKLSVLEKLRRSGENQDDDDLFYDSDRDRQIANQALVAHADYLPDESWDIDPRPRKKVKHTYSARQKQATESFSGLRKGTVKRPAGRNLSNTGEGPNDDPPEVKVGVDGDEDPDAREPLFNGTYSENIMRLYRRATAKHNAEIADISQPKKAVFNRGNERLKLCKGIAGSVSNLLKATQGTIGKKSRGTLSLYATCLKRMPEFIADEEYFARIEQSDSNRDIISEIYTHLESLSISDSWKPLRTIARAHGIQHLCVAIDQNVVGIGMALEMVQTCLQENAIDEAVVIMRQVVCTHSKMLQVTGEAATSQDQSHILGGFLRISAQLGDGRKTMRFLSTQMRTPSALQAYEPLLINPTVSAMNSVRNYLQNDRLSEASNYLRAIIKASFCSGAENIISKIMSMRAEGTRTGKRISLRRCMQNEIAQPLPLDRESEGTKRSREEIDSHRESPVCVSEILVTLTAVTLTYQDRLAQDESIYCPDIAVMLGAIAQQARQVIEVSGVQHCSLRQRQAMAVVLVAKILSGGSSTSLHSTEVSSPCPREVSALVEMSLQNFEISYLGLFVYRVACLCEFYKGGLKFDMMQTLLDSLLCAIKRCPSGQPDRSLLQKVAVASAFAFSEASKQPSHMEWALGIEERIFGKDCMTPDRITLRTPAKMVGKSRIGFRWEEGISEWVTKTPASTVSRWDMTPTQLDMTIDELDDTTLVEEWPMRVPVQPTLVESADELECAQKSGKAKMVDDQGDNEPIKSALVLNDVAEAGAQSSGSSSFTTTDHERKGSLSMPHDDQMDELSADWGSQHSTQSSFKSLRPNNFDHRARRSMLDRRAKGSGHSAQALAAGRSLAALVDHDNQSSDMEDELGM